MAITKDQVREKMEQLRSNGDSDSTANILELLGTGSKSTIDKYRKIILSEEQAPAVDVPAPLLRALTAAWATQSRKSLEDAMAMSQALVNQAEKRADEAVAELSKEAAKAKRLEETLTDARKANNVHRADLKSMQLKLEKRTAELERLKGQMILLESQLKDAAKRAERGR